MNFSTGKIEEPVIKTENKADFKIRHNGKENDSGGESSTKLVATCHKCVKDGYINNRKSNING